MKSTFNEKVFDLRQSKIKLIHDYKQFKLDVYMIQNELDDPDVTTPPNFPEVLNDESTDVRISNYIYIYIRYIIRTLKK